MINGRLLYIVDSYEYSEIKPLSCTPKTRANLQAALHSLLFHQWLGSGASRQVQRVSRVALPGHSQLVYRCTI